MPKKKTSKAVSGSGSLEEAGSKDIKSHVERISDDHYVFSMEMTPKQHALYQRLLELEEDADPDRIFAEMVEQRLAKLTVKKLGKLR